MWFPCLYGCDLTTQEDYTVLYGQFTLLPLSPTSLRRCLVPCGPRWFRPFPSLPRRETRKYESLILGWLWTRSLRQEVLVLSQSKVRRFGGSTPWDNRVETLSLVSRQIHTCRVVTVSPSPPTTTDLREVVSLRGDDSVSLNLGRWVIGRFHEVVSDHSDDTTGIVGAGGAWTSFPSGTDWKVVEGRRTGHPEGWDPPLQGNLCGRIGPREGSRSQREVSEGGCVKSTSFPM